MRAATLILCSLSIAPLAACGGAGDRTDAGHADSGSPADSGISSDAGPPDSGVTLSRVQPLISVTCYSEHGCHENTASFGAGCYFDGGSGGFATYPLDALGAVALINTINVPSVYSPKLRVKPFEPDASFLMDKLEDHLMACEGEQMPPGGSLTADQIALIREWIAEGARTQ